MPEPIARVDCPAVPLPGDGTAAQSRAGTGGRRTTSGTGGGTTSLKTLALRLLERDSPRDTIGTAADSSPSHSVPLLGQRVAYSGTVPVRAGQTRDNRAAKPQAAIDLGKLPAGLCSDCDGGLWWRVSRLEPHGPGPWRCCRCDRPHPDTWLDGHAVGWIFRNSVGEKLHDRPAA